MKGKVKKFSNPSFKKDKEIIDKLNPSLWLRKEVSK